MEGKREGEREREEGGREREKVCYNVIESPLRYKMSGLHSLCHKT